MWALRRGISGIEGRSRSRNKLTPYATARGPGFSESYDRYDANPPGTFRTRGIVIVVSKKPAPGKLWVFCADALDRDATVDLALLANGYSIVTPPITMQAGMVRAQWDETYRTMVDNGFSKTPAMEATGAKGGEMYAWATANPEKISSIYARNLTLHSLMSPAPVIDNLVTWGLSPKPAFRVFTIAVARIPR